MARTLQYIGSIALLLLFLGGGSQSSLAQSVGFKATVSQNPIPANKNFQYTLTLVNQNGRMGQPDFGELQVVGGPSTSNSTRIVNGRRSSELSYTWVLRAKKIGKYTIPAAQAQVNGKMIKSNAITVDVTKGTTGTELRSNAEIQVDVQLSQRSAYVGEQIVVVYKLYSRFPDLRFESIEYPSMDGFWTETIEEEMIEWEPQMKIINGVQYRSAVLKTEVLYAQRPGKLIIDKVELVAQGKRSFFDRYQQMVARSAPITLNIKALPPAPEGMENLGTFENLSLAVELDREQLPANEAANLKLKFSGRGNLKLLDNPELQFPADLEVFDPKRDDRISLNAGGMSGSRSFEYVLIPRTQGRYSIPGLDLGYFDVNAKQYKTLSMGDIELMVSKGSGDESSYTYNSKTDVSILNSDIRFILSDANLLEPVKSHFFASMGYYGLSLLPLLAFAFVWIRKRKEESIKSNPEEYQMRRAGKLARKQLASAKELLNKGETQSFYGELLSALQGYLSDKFGIPLSELSERKLAERLQGSLGDERIQELSNLMQEAEMARFAGLGINNGKDTLAKAEALLTAIEKEVKS